MLGKFLTKSLTILTTPFLLISFLLPLQVFGQSVGIEKAVEQNAILCRTLGSNPSDSGNTTPTTTQPKYITADIFTNNFSYHTDYQNTVNSITNSKDGKLALTQAFDPFGVQKSFSVNSVLGNSSNSSNTSNGNSNNPNLSSPFNTQIPLYSYSGSLDEGRGKVRETTPIATPKKEDTTPALAERPLDRGAGEQLSSQSATLNFGRRSYNPTQGIFTSQDPVTQGVSYNVNGTDQLVGENHQSLSNSTNNQYSLINQNPRGGKDVDGYDTQTDIDNNNKAIQSQQDFYTSYKNNYNTDIEHYQGVINQIKQDKASGLYDVYPSWQQYAHSPEKVANDELATQIAFSAICSSDTIYPYNCNSYHSQIAKNYDLSVSPNINGFSKYRIDNKTISQTYFDKLTEYDTKLTLASLNLSVLSQGNGKAMDSFKTAGDRLQEKLSNEQFKQKYGENPCIGFDGTLQPEGLCYEEPNAQIRGIPILDELILDDLGNCFFGGGESNRALSCTFVIPWGKGLKALKLGKEILFAGKTAEELAQAGKVIDKADKAGKLTVAGRALAKHGSEFGKRAGSIFPKALGNQKQINLAGQKVLEEIITDPQAVMTAGNNILRYGENYVITDSLGRGARYSANGEFIGFLNP